MALFSHTGTTLTDTDIAETAWLAGTDLTLTDISIFARHEITGCTDDPSCEAEVGSGYLCDTASSLCYLPGSCDASNPSLAPCLSPTTCEPGLLGGDLCTGCTTAGGGCRTGETCLDIGIPGPSGVGLGDMGIPGP